tara:strand:- start:19 stop:663 length:645 start_codon:yes stop_codon:yes gene_type:complete
MNTKRSGFSSMAEEAHLHNLIIDKREIFLHGNYSPDEGDSGGDPGVDWRMANSFMKNLRILETISSEDIIIHQMSIGGDEEAGYMIYDAIKQSKCHITIYTHGVAASMGSIVPQAADHRITMPNCCWLIHRGTTGIGGHLTRKQAKSWSAWEEYGDKRMINLYASRCVHAPKYEDKSESHVRSDIKRKLDSRGDWFLTAHDAVEYGFADAVGGA